MLFVYPRQREEKQEEELSKIKQSFGNKVKKYNCIREIDVLCVRSDTLFLQ